MSSAPPPQPNLLPFQQQNVASNQQRVPLPYLGGERLFTVKWIAPALNKLTQQAPGGGKKG